jgi:2-polyprenyl-6-methoxyphenol hydroxylase-like FAD-dependent oxidoreductase
VAPSDEAEGARTDVPKTDVLIIGAGPTGLVLALWLARLGVRPRVIDKAPQPGQTSRAVGVQARTLELYRQMDLAKPLVEQGLPNRSANLWTRGRRTARIELSAMGQGLSPFPYMLIYPQDEHEKLLIERLAAAGVAVERPTELLDFEERSDHVGARLRQADGTVEDCDATYLAGCDGARSKVREGLSLGFPGGTYAHLFYVADVEASGPPVNRELHIAFDESDFLACFPLRGDTHVRLIGTVRAEAEREDENLDWSVVNKRTIERLQVNVTRVNWFSTYRVHHRVASAFRVGRAFILGDAAHIHSPVGGQGMNTGIGDAVNLAWKLAAALKGQADAQILGSYEEERIPFARRLVQTTDRAFQLVSSDGPIARRVRLDVAPRLLSALLRLRIARRFMFDTISQIRVSYPASRLSEGRAGRVRGGDRLPWVAYENGADNFDPLVSLGWQVHVYGEATSELRRACDAHRVPLQSLPWEVRAEHAGLARDAAYLVRPDGYVGLATESRAGPERLDRYVRTRGVRLFA